MNEQKTKRFFLMEIRPIRRAWYVLERFPPFFKVALSKQGLPTADGRRLVFGKFRRICLSFFPPIARWLQKHYGLSGECQHCSSSCKLLFQCPHWDDQSSRCSVYEDRPNTCRLFPITPGDIKDRNVGSPKIPCGFKFK